jgi:hypothetical protein
LVLKTKSVFFEKCADPLRGRDMTLKWAKSGLIG